MGSSGKATSGGSSVPHGAYVARSTATPQACAPSSTTRINFDIEDHAPDAGLGIVWNAGLKRFALPGGLYSVLWTMTIAAAPGATDGAEVAANIDNAVAVLGNFRLDPSMGAVQAGYAVNETFVQAAPDSVLYVNVNPFGADPGDELTVSAASVTITCIG